MIAYIKRNALYILLVITTTSSLYSCVMGLVIHENVNELQEADEEMMASVQNMKSTLEVPKEYVKLSDSLAYYKTEKKWVETSSGYDKKGRNFTLHRFYFKRAIYTDSLSSGFSVIIADFGKSGIIIENQKNVVLPENMLGEKELNWKNKMDSLTSNKKMYSNLSSAGMQIRTNIRSTKM